MTRIRNFWDLRKDSKVRNAEAFFTPPEVEFLLFNCTEVSRTEKRTADVTHMSALSESEACEL